MTSPSESCTALDQKKAIQEELRKGKEAAVLLGSRLQDPEVSSLVEQVMGSFSRTLCLLDGANPMVFGSPSSDDVRSETNSYGKRKVSEEYGRGGCRKRYILWVLSFARNIFALFLFACFLEKCTCGAPHLFDTDHILTILQFYNLHLNPKPGFRIYEK